MSDHQGNPPKVPADSDRGGVLNARAGDLLLLEYERSSEFCNHVDDVRNVLTSFFLTVSGAAVFVLARYLEGHLEIRAPLSARLLTSCVCLAVAGLGALFVLSIARLRRVQVERYLVMDNILDAVLDPSQRRLVSFRRDAVLGKNSPARRRTAGSYLWTLAVLLPAAALMGVAVTLVTAPAGRWTASVLGALSTVVSIGLLDMAYRRFSNYP